MPAFNFKARFAEDVASFKKPNTIRRNRKCKVGDPIYLYTGMRQKGCRKLGEGICTKVFKVIIQRTKLTTVVKKKVEVFTTVGSLDAFAQQDGFKDWAEMSTWFKDMYGLPFTGWFHAWKPRP